MASAIPPGSGTATCPRLPRHHARLVEAELIRRGLSATPGAVPTRAAMPSKLPKSGLPSANRSPGCRMP